MTPIIIQSEPIEKKERVWYWTQVTSNSSDLPNAALQWELNSDVMRVGELSGDDGWIVLVFARPLVNGFFCNVSHTWYRKEATFQIWFLSINILNLLCWVWHLKVVCCVTYMKREWGVDGGVAGNKAALKSRHRDKCVLQCALCFIPRLWLWRIFFVLRAFFCLFKINWKILVLSASKQQQQQLLQCHCLPDLKVTGFRFTAGICCES